MICPTYPTVAWSGTAKKVARHEPTKSLLKGPSSSRLRIRSDCRSLDAILLLDLSEFAALSARDTEPIAAFEVVVCSPTRCGDAARMS